MPNYTFPKSERLTLEKDIQALFSGSASVFSYPFKCLYQARKDHETTAAPKILISVPKKSFRKAHDRNRIKRLIRESYRLQKPFLIEQNLPICTIGFIYIAKEIMSYQDVSDRMRVLLKKLAAEGMK